MTAEQLLRHASQVTFLVISGFVFVQAFRRPRAASLHAAGFFGIAAAIITFGWAVDAFGWEPPTFMTRGSTALLVAMPFFLLLLANDFAGVPRSILAAAAVLLAAIAVTLFVLPMPFAPAYLLLVVGYIVATVVYSTARFGMAAQESSSVSRRRMQAVAIAGALFALVFVFAGLGIALPDQAGAMASMSNIASVACAVAYFAGFSPPRFIRQAWQAPQMQRFFASSTLVPRASLVELTASLEAAIGAMLGARQVVISTWDEQAQSLIAPRYAEAPGTTTDRESTVAYRSFRTQTAIFVEDAERADPVNADLYRAYAAHAIMAAPITIDDRRLGLLIVFGERAPLFAEDELEIAQILARQVAVLLRDFELANELTVLRARQVAALLKDDFLSAAAHDLKTPLTTLVAQSQLMQRRATQDPQRPPDLEGITRMVNESRRMSAVVNDLLDAARGDQIGFVGEVEPVDLQALVAEVIAGLPAGRSVNLEATPVTVSVDANRIRQVVNNLLDNAIKYSPGGGDIHVTLTMEQDAVSLVVADPGIGIAAEDIGVIFERFGRATAVQHRSMTGLGLGLYFCKRIVEEHGGEIGVNSVFGAGSEFRVRLPLTPKVDVLQPSEAPA